MTALEYGEDVGCLDAIITTRKKIRNDIEYFKMQFSVGSRAAPHDQQEQSLRLFKCKRTEPDNPS